MQSLKCWCSDKVVLDRVHAAFLENNIILCYQIIIPAAYSRYRQSSEGAVLKLEVEVKDKRFGYWKVSCEWSINETDGSDNEVIQGFAWTFIGPEWT